MSLLCFQGHIWITPIGPLWYGVAWVDLIFVAIIFALLLAAATPNYRYIETEDQNSETVGYVERNRYSRDSAVALGAFFWFLLLFFIAAAIIGIFA